VVKPEPLELEDERSERVRRSHAAAIVELQGLPCATQRVVSNVQLANNVPKVVNHKLGRSPSFVSTSVPRGATSAGFIVEVRGGNIDPTKSVVLTASGFGATITVDVSFQ
jgi:hypothetical protein